MGLRNSGHIRCDHKYLEMSHCTGYIFAATREGWNREHVYTDSLCSLMIKKFEVFGIFGVYNPSSTWNYTFGVLLCSIVYMVCQIAKQLMYTKEWYMQCTLTKEGI